MSLTLTTRQKKAALEVIAATILRNPFIPHQPTRKQALALGLLNLREVLYGGAAGGGKSDWLLMAGLQFVTFPGYAGLILRRSYKDLSLPGALMDRAHQWLGGTDARWNESTKTWTFPSEATLTFGYLERDQHVYQYQGSELQFIGFDELTQFSEFQFQYMNSRLRRLIGVPIPLRQYGASNPGGRGHEWVKERFVTSHDHRRQFIPARLEDNPHLDQEGYRESLSYLDPVTRQQLLSGDWDLIDTGDFFKRVWFQRIPGDRVPRLTRIVRFWDLAGSRPKSSYLDPDWTVGTKMGLGVDARTYILGVDRFRGTPDEVLRRVKWNAEHDGIGTEVLIEREPGSAGKFTAAQFARELQAFPYKAIPARGSKLDRARPFSSAAEREEISYVDGALDGDWFNELEMFPDPRVHDDRVDSASGAYVFLHPASKPDRDERRSHSMRSW